MNYAIVTFGCRVNQADSQHIDDELRGVGGHEVPANRADVVIVNTCSVTASADQGARQTIRRIGRDNPDARIVVTGCYATRCAEDVRSLPQVLHVVPNTHKEGLVAGLAAAGLVTTAERFGDGGGPCGLSITPGDPGRTASTLRVTCEGARGRNVAISFADTGVGIKPEHLQRIFDLYFTTKAKGSGIGLSMVYRTVQMHDGEIEVQSTRGAGTTFRVLLPQA